MSDQTIILSPSHEGPSQYEPAHEIHSADAAAVVRRLVERVASRLRTTDAGVPMAMACVAVLLAIGISMLLDATIGLHYAARAALMLVAIAGAGILVLRGVRAWKSHFSLTPAALIIERFVPESGGRVISALQLGDPSTSAIPVGASLGMIRRLEVEAARAIASVDPRQVVRTDALVSWLAAASMVLGALTATAALGGPSARGFLLRALLVPGIDRPTATRINVVSMDPIVAPRGEDVVLECEVDGEIPIDGRLRFIDERGEQFDVPTRRLIDDASRETSRTGVLFQATIPKLMNGGTYSFAIGDAVSKPRRVTAVDRPAVAGIKFSRTLPDYTHAGTQVIEGAAVELLMGSRLDVDVRASRAVGPIGRASRQGTLKFFDEQGTEIGSEMLMTRADDAARLELARPGKNGISPPIFPPIAARSMSVELVDENGMTSTREARYPLTWKTDTPAVLTLVRPTKLSRIVTPWAKLGVRYQVRDDWGVMRVELDYSIDRQDRVVMREGDGLAASYFANRVQMGKPAVTTIEKFAAGLQAVWKDGVPGPGLPADKFSARFEGFILIEETGGYEFRTEADDRARLFIDGEKLIDMYSESRNQSRRTTLKAGIFPIRVDYAEDGGWASMRLLYRREGEFKLVPGNLLFSTEQQVAKSRMTQSQMIHSSEKGEKNLSAQTVLDLSKLSAMPGDTVRWSLRATDGAGNVTVGPTVVLVVSEENQVRQSLLNELGDYLDDVGKVESRQSGLADEIDAGEKTRSDKLPR